jgi:hypothetical protein
MSPRVFYIRRWPLKKFTGVCLPPLGVFIRYDNKGNNKLLSHELAHWNQYEERSVIRFYLGYIYWWIRSGFSYQNHPWEVEAREKTHNV